MPHFVCIAVVDPHGRVLLQERDEHAAVAPDLWSLPGGGIHEGEDPRDAAVRELAEETELVVPSGDLADLGDFQVQLDGPADYRVYAVRADVGNEDVTCHEGRRIIFVERSAVDDLPLADATRQVLRTLDAWIEETREPPMLAAVLLVDPRGRLLLQQRDEHPALDPLKWGLVGGHLDPGEEFEPGARRELAEETGVLLGPGALTFFAEYAVHDGRMQVFAARVDLTDDDVECHEGLQIVFVDPEEAPRLDLGTAASVSVVDFLGSSLYAELAR